MPSPPIGEPHAPRSGGAVEEHPSEQACHDAYRVARLHIHVLRADTETIAALAAVDWNRHFRQVCLDPVRGLITLMAPSNRHEDLTSVFDDLVEAAGFILAGAARKLRSPRLRGTDEPPGTGMEPDCAFYVGGRARGYYAACKEGDSAVEAYLEHTAPDLVVEVEVTNADEGKAERYGEMGVRELWRLDGRVGVKKLRAEFLALSPGSTPHRLDALGGARRTHTGGCVRGGRRGAGRPDP